MAEGGFKKWAPRAGLRVRATNAEIVTEPAKVTANSRKRIPVVPL